MKNIILSKDGFDDDYLYLTEEQFKLLEFLKKIGYLDNDVYYTDVTDQPIFRAID